jgi:hypothetical protein
MRDNQTHHGAIHRAPPAKTTPTHERVAEALNVGAYCSKANAQRRPFLEFLPYPDHERDVNDERVIGLRTSVAEPRQLDTRPRHHSRHSTSEVTPSQTMA